MKFRYIPIPFGESTKVLSGSSVGGEDGRVITLGFWGKGHLIGQLLSTLRPYQAECLTDVELQAFQPETQIPQQALLEKIWNSEKLLQILQQHTLSDRLLHLLEWLAEQFGQRVAEGICLDIPLTHQQMADTVGATRVTVTRLLQHFEHSGKLRRLKKKHYLQPQRGRSPSSSYLILNSPKHS